MKKWRDVLKIINGKNQKNVENTKGNYPIYGSGGIIGYADKYLCDKNTVVIGRKGNINKPIYVEEPFWNVDTAFGLKTNEDELVPKYLYYFCVNFDFNSLNTTVTIPSLTKANLLNIDMPIPAKDRQNEIIFNLDKIEEIINIRKLEINKLDSLVKSRFIEMFGGSVSKSKGYMVKKLKEICTVGSSKRIYQKEQTLTGIPFLRISDLTAKVQGDDVDYKLFISATKYDELQVAGLTPKSGDILVTSRGTLGLCYIIQPTDKFYFQDGMISWLRTSGTDIDPIYLTTLFTTSDIKKQINKATSGSTVSYLSITQLAELNILLPPIKLQNQFARFVQQVDKSKLAIQKSLDKLEILQKSLMQQYFG